MARVVPWAVLLVVADYSVMERRGIDKGAQIVASGKIGRLDAVHCLQQQLPVGVAIAGDDDLAGQSGKPCSKSVGQLGAVDGGADVAQKGKHSGPYKVVAPVGPVVGSLQVELVTAVLADHPDAYQVTVDEVREFGVEEYQHESRLLLPWAVCEPVCPCVCKGVMLALVRVVLEVCGEQQLVDFGAIDPARLDPDRDAAF